MKAWMRHYDDRLRTAGEAVRYVKSGDRIVFSHACGEPRVLPEALVDRAGDLTDVHIYHMISPGEAAYCRPQHANSFRHVTFFVGPATREAVWDNRGDYVPVFFSEIPALFDARFSVDVAMVTVSPPDDKGACSLGISVDYTKKAVETAKLVIAEVNPTMPRTHGDSFVPVSEIDYFVKGEKPIHELRRAPLTEVDQAIGKHVAGLVEDGSCLQLGIGGIPDAVLHHLTGCKDLGIHSEMVSDGAMTLVEKGVITGRRKTIHRGKIVVSFLMGSRQFYDWVNDNSMFDMRTVDYTNNVHVIAKNTNMVSINSALEVDLTGQVCADTLGTKQYSGVGGQVDFVRGARMSYGGKAVIALPSRAGGGASRICPTIKQGAAITTSRNDVDYVVTEYGIAALKGRTVRERMRSLIAVAHPDFREDLEKKAYEVYHVLL